MSEEPEEEHDDFHTPEALSYASSMRDEEDSDPAHVDFFSAEEADSLECSDADEDQPEFGLNALEALARGLVGRSPGKYVASSEREAERQVHVHSEVFPTAIRRLLPVEEFPGGEVSSRRDVQAESTNSGVAGRTEISEEEGQTAPAMPPSMPGSSSLGTRLPRQGRQEERGTEERKGAPREGNGNVLHEEEVTHEITRYGTDEEAERAEGLDRVTELVPHGSQASSEVAPSEGDDDMTGPIHALAMASVPASRHDVQQLQKLFKQFHKEAREVDTDGRLPVHCLAQNRREANEHDATLLEMFMKKYPAGAEEVDDEGNNVLHCLCQNERPANRHDVAMLKIILERCPLTAKHKDGDGMHPLQSLASNARQSTEHDLTMLNLLLKVFPDAAKQRSREGLNAVHSLCLKKGDASQHDVLILTSLLEVFPDAVRKRDGAGRYPLHCLARNLRPANEFDAAMMEALVQVFPEAVQAKDDDDWYPFNCLMLSPREPTDPHIIMSASLLEAFPQAEHNEIDKRNSWPLKGTREDETDSICTLA